MKTQITKSKRILDKTIVDVYWRLNDDVNILHIFAIYHQLTDLTVMVS